MISDHSVIVHPIPPTWDEYSEILILGSFPSVKSREAGYFYGHPQNRFWKVMAFVFQDAVPLTIPEKRAFLLKNQVALWDVIASCEIWGSSDASIRHAIPNDLSPILQAGRIRQIFCNGAKSFELYRKYTEPLTGRSAVKLPSTSPAYTLSYERKLAQWRLALNYEHESL